MPIESHRVDMSKKLESHANYRMRKIAQKNSHRADAASDKLVSKGLVHF